MGASSDTVTGHFPILVLFHLTTNKTQIYQIFYDRDGNLGSGEGSKSQTLEIVGLWAPEKLKIKQLVLLGA